MTETGTHEAGRAASGRERSPRRRRLVVAVTAVVLVTVAVWIGFASKSSDSGPIDGETVGRTVSPSATPPSFSVPAERRYSDEELGLDAVIDDFVEIMTPVDTRFRSTSDRHEYRFERHRYMEEEAVGHERERLWFEFNLASAFANSYDDLPADLGDSGLLFQAFEEAMDRCAQAEGWPGVRLYGVSQSDVEQFEIDFGLSLDEFLDLRYECAQQAATYPTLDPLVRDELLGRLREHYRAAAHEYLREFPDAEVPLVDHEGAPRPFEETTIWICQKEPDPAACAAEFRVELPATE